MPTITAQGKTVSCAVGANLREVLLANDIDLYSPRAKYINCMGIGTCGTCAVAIDEADKGAVSKTNWKDIARRNLPPHDPKKALRLACQTKVLGDISITKFEGFWGHQEGVAWSAKQEIDT
ncbi:MAG: 2Fe-2S iron-sulfur cluster-binding protein [Phormidesmis sp.]